MTSGPVPGVNGLSPGVPVPANAGLTWDAENRLVKAVVNDTTVHYAYDHQSRLISRSVGVSPTSATRYLYDGWNRIAEYESDGSGHTLKRSYLWGMDLSGSMQGAGGVGGLLSMTVHSSTPATFYPTYDGNGNISEYVNQSGTKAAHFEYDPFGNLTVDSENNAAQFPYRFSTKPQDLITGLYYYGYRWYDPLTGRWPSRDPIGERGGVNLYGFLANSPITIMDVIGASPYPGIYQNLNHLENDPARLAIHKATRADLAEGEWDSSDEAGRYGASAAAFLTIHGPRRLEDPRDPDPETSLVSIVEYFGRICCKSRASGYKSHSVN
jgi:RHS repeat-associated protein